VTAQLVDSGGALTVRRQDPFGQSRSGAVVAWADGHGFLNAATSTVTGLTQLGARLYDASLGRFLSVDAVLSPFNPVQNNGYSYAGNSPIGRSDPSGNYFVGGSLGDCGSSGCSGTAGTGGTKTSTTKKGPSAKKGPDLGSVLKKYWDTSWDNEGQFLSGIGDGLYGIGKFFLWDSTIIGTSIKAANSIGCLSNYSSCEKQQEAAAAPWQKDFWGTAEKTFIQPTLDDFANHPAHAIGELVPDVAMFAIPGGGLVKGARVAEEADAAAAAGATLTRPMQWESANAAFTASGELKQEVIDGSRKIIDGSQLNSRLQANLTADGSNIADWGKYSTQTIRGPAGDFQVHFYMNGRTGAIDYQYDYKAVLNGGK
jgi:RHS repeat-associated protein